MSELKTLYRHCAHYLGGRVCLMLLGFLSFPVLTRIFSVAEYGTMSLVLKILLLLTVIGKFGLQNSVQRFYAEDGASPDLSHSRRFYSTLLFGSGMTGLTVMMVFVGVLWLAPSGTLGTSLRQLFLLAAVLVVVRSMYPTLLGFLRAEGRTRTYNVVEISVKACTVVAICLLLLFWRRSLNVFFGVTLAAEVAGVLILMLVLYRRGVLDIRAMDWSYFRQMAFFAFPLIGYELASVILDSGDRLLVQHFLGAQSLGFYSAAYNVSTYIEESLMVPINLALFPIYMKLWVEKGKGETQAFLSRSLNNFLALAVGVGCLALLTSSDVIVVLASRKFQQAHSLIPVLVTGLLIYAVHIFLNAALLIYKKTALMTRLVVYACVANLILNVILIPRMGLQGAAVATLLSYLMLVVMMGRVSFRLLPLQISYSGFLWNMAAGALTYVVIRPIHLYSALASAGVKGSLGALTYSIFLFALNPGIRNQLAGMLRQRHDAGKAHRAEMAVS
jgi:O-antigen/teichoic acid export membrane protein